jgi:hypothetical protein
MSKLFNRKAFIPFWLLTCVLFAGLSSPMSWTTGFSCHRRDRGALRRDLLWKVPPPTIAEVLNRVERPTTRF